ncbi:MAG: heme exporter protein CcmB [Pirellulaceae bacterium]|nr:heme exporter protein CcmB [Planctomycetales bacterium]
MDLRWWWIVQKDLATEYRGWNTWPRMLLLGLLMAFLTSYMAIASSGDNSRTAAGICWLTICLAATISLSHSMQDEQNPCCWESLRLYPISPSTIYAAKLTVNTLSLAALQLVVIPCFAVTTNVTWMSHPLLLVVVACLGNLAINSVGTVAAALTVRWQSSHGLLVLLTLPLLIPVILAAAESTRLLDHAAAHGPWRDWLLLLTAFAVVYLTAGWVLFEYLVED